MTAAAFSSAPNSSSPQPTGFPTETAQPIFSPFQSQQQQQLQLHSAQQPAMMELSGHSGPPSLHHHLEIMGECLHLATNCMVFTGSAASACAAQIGTAPSSQGYCLCNIAKLATVTRGQDRHVSAIMLQARKPQWSAQARPDL